MRSATCLVAGHLSLECRALVFGGLSIGADPQVERGALNLRHVLLATLVAAVMPEGHTCDIRSLYVQTAPLKPAENRGCGTSISAGISV
jgi:hypothetical protein